MKNKNYSKTVDKLSKMAIIDNSNEELRTWYLGDRLNISELNIKWIEATNERSGHFEQFVVFIK